MLAQIFLSPSTIEELITQVLMERQLRRSDQLLLKRALLDEAQLNEEEQILIDRVFYGVRHGLLKIVE